MRRDEPQYTWDGWGVLSSPCTLNRSEKWHHVQIWQLFLPSSDTTLAGCSLCMWLSASRPPFRNNNKLPPLTHSVQFSGTRLTHANIHATESFRDGEMQHMPRHIKNKIKYSSLLQSLPITPRRFHTNLIWDVESQAWACILSSHFAILVGLWSFVNVVNKKLLLVDVSSYAKEASYQSSAKSQGEDSIYKEH